MICLPLRKMGTFLFLLACIITSGIAHAKDKFRDLPEPAPLVWMQSDARLQTPVVMDVSSKPLRVVLEDISRRTQLTLTAERELGEYRISIHTQSQPLARIMGRLLDLFGHGKLPNTGYEWQRRGNEKRPSAYYLSRNRRAIEEEMALLDMPRQTTNRWLKELRDYTCASQEEQAKFSTDCPCLQSFLRPGNKILSGDISPLGEAVKALTDAQMETLLKQGSVDIPDLLFSEQAQQSLIPSPEVPGVSPSPTRARPDASGAVLRIEQEDSPDATGAFYLGVYPHTHAYCSRQFVFDTQHQTNPLLDTQEMQMSPQEKQGSIVDILAHAPREALAGSPPSMPFENVVALLAKEAQINVYGEMFPRRPIQLDRAKGTPEEILTYACARAGCRWRRVGGDYLLYSKSWAQG